MWPGLGVYVALLALRVALSYSSLRHYLRLPLIEQVKIVPRLPSLTVVSPAGRDEGRLSVLLASLNKLDYPQLDVVVVDAGCQATADCAARYGVTVVQAGQTPPGWSADAHASWTGAREATSEWLLFTDPGTRFEADDALQRIVSFALGRKAPGLSVFVQQQAITFWERTLLPFAFQQFFVSAPPDRINRPQDPLALANQHCMLFEREAYFQAGGHEAVHTHRPTDLALAARFKQRGLLFLAARAERQGSVRPFDGLAAIWAGLGRHARSSARYLSSRGLGAMISVALGLLPLAGIIAGGVLHLWPLAIAGVLAYVTAVVELFFWQWLFQAPLLDAAWQPLTALVWLAVVILPSPRAAAR